MSQHIYSDGIVVVTLGYDPILDYVFCIIERDGEYVYSNLSDPDAGTGQQSVDYYRPIILEATGVTVPVAMFGEVKSDQAHRVGNRVVHYGESSKG